MSDGRSIPGVETLDDGSKSLNVEVFLRNSLAQPEVLTREAGPQRLVEETTLRLLDMGEVELAACLHFASNLRACDLQDEAMKALFYILADLSARGLFRDIPVIFRDPHEG